MKHLKALATLVSAVFITILSFAQNSNNSNTGLADLVFIPGKTQISTESTYWDFNVKLIVGVKNNGGKDILLPFRIGYYLTKTNSVSTNDLYLNSGEFAYMYKGSEGTMTININLGYENFKLVENGIYHIGVIADYKNEIKESDETNNSYVVEQAVNYVVPPGLASKYADEKAKTNAENAEKEMAGKILFTYGSIDPGDISKNKFSNNFTFKQFTEVQGVNGADFSFIVFYKQPLKDLFQKYISNGLDAKTWNTSVNYTNLYFKVYIDGKETAVSANEVENVSFNASSYTYSLLGEYANSQTLKLQYILQSELYKLCAGKHTVKIETYAKSNLTITNNVGSDVISEGEFTIDVTAADKISYFKKRGAEIYPVSAMNNPAVEASAKNLAVKFLSGLDSKFTQASIKYFAFNSSAWNYVKNSLGKVEYRWVSVMMYVKLSDGSCKVASFKVEQQCTGPNAYGQANMGLGYTYDKILSPMPCEVLK
ncbi:MAG: CARDB domain-containing protein [Bacteroidota bacterium]